MEEGCLKHWEFTRAVRREVLSGSVDIFTVVKIYINEPRQRKHSEFVKFENSEENNKFRAGSTKKVSEVWQSTVLKVVVCTKMELYTAGLSIKN